MATRGQQKKRNYNLNKKELTKLEKEAEKKSAERQKANRAKSRAEMRKRTQPNATKSKAELSKLEKEAEKKSTQRQAANKAQSRAEMSKRTPPKPGKRRAAVQERRKVAGRDSNLRTEDRRTKSTTAKKAASTASRVGRLVRGATGVGAALQSEKLGGGRDTMKGIESRRNEFVDRETARQAKAKEKNYNVGVSKGGVPFREAFAHFRKKGAKTFTWNGKKYTTELKK